MREIRLSGSERGGFDFDRFSLPLSLALRTLETVVAVPVPDGGRTARRMMASPAAGKASSDIPAFKPYRGKPAVRNFRGGDGNVGIIQSPVRAIVSPDRE